MAESISTAFPSFANTWTVALAVLIADRPAAAGITATAAVLPFKNDNKYVKHGSVSIKARRRRTRLRYSCKNTARGDGGRVNFDGLPYFARTWTVALAVLIAGRPQRKIQPPRRSSHESTDMHDLYACLHNRIPS